MSRSALRVLGVFAASLGLVVAFAACGDSGTSQDELDRARNEGATQARQQEKIKRIEEQVKSLKHGHAANPTNTSSAPLSAGGGTSCGGGLSVGPKTTCAFAANVENDYYNEIGTGAGSVLSYSPVTERLYTMYCTAGTPHECTGGNDASVYFP